MVTKEFKTANVMKESPPIIIIIIIIHNNIIIRGVYEMKNTYGGEGAKTAIGTA